MRRDRRPGEASGIAAAGRIGLVHNGIIENHDELRAELQAAGYAFVTQTDTEVIAHLVDRLYDGDLLEAVQRAVPRLRGAYRHRRVLPRRAAPRGRRAPGLAADPRRRQRPGASETFLASDAMALAGVTDQIVYLEEGDVVDIQLGKHWIAHADAERHLAQRRAAGEDGAWRTAAPPSSARTGTTCRRRSSSSRGPSPTRSTPCPASRPSCSATARTASSRRSSRC